MSNFILKSAVGEACSPQHFNKKILPDLESLYSAIKPGLDQQNQFIYLGATRKGGPWPTTPPCGRTRIAFSWMEIFKVPPSRPIPACPRRG